MGGGLIKHVVVFQLIVQLRRPIFIKWGNKISSPRNFSGYGTTSFVRILIADEKERLINCVMKSGSTFKIIHKHIMA